MTLHCGLISISSLSVTSQSWKKKDSFSSVNRLYKY